MRQTAHKGANIHGVGPSMITVGFHNNLHHLAQGKSQNVGQHIRILARMECMFCHVVTQRRRQHAPGRPAASYYYTAAAVRPFCLFARVAQLSRARNGERGEKG